MQQVVFYIIKGNVQPLKLGASWAYTTFPWITQKIVTTDTFHWLELITTDLSSSLEKTSIKFFLIFQKIYEKVLNDHILKGFCISIKNSSGH